MRLNLERRTQALLALVEQYRAEHCDEVLQPARAQAAAVLRGALADARRRVRTAIAEARQRVAGEIGAAQAKLATAHRLAGQQQAVQVLAIGWAALRDELLARWRSPASRSFWVDAQLARALRALPRAGWQIEHAADWPQAEREALAQRLAAEGIAVAAWQPRPEIAAGLRIRAGNNLIDATLDGLLADRSELEGRLLALLGEGRR